MQNMSGKGPLNDPGSKSSTPSEYSSAVLIGCIIAIIVLAHLIFAGIVTEIGNGHKYSKWVKKLYL